MKTKGMILSIILTAVILVSSCSQLQAAPMPQTLANSTQSIVSDVKQTDRSVFDQIQDNINMVTALRDRVASYNGTDRQKILNDVIGQLEAVTVSYENLAAKRADIRKQLLDKITNLQTLQQKVGSETSRLREQRVSYIMLLNSSASDPNPEIARTKKMALTQAVKYVDMEIQLWTDFANTQSQITHETQDVQQRIDSFLSMIDSSAILFREGLNYLKLQRDINDALSLFTQDMPKIEQLSRDMETSWSHLDMLVNTLGGMSMNVQISR